MRIFHHGDGAARKFWNIELAGKTFTVTTGRAGTRGRVRTETFPDESSARAAADRLIARKLREGFREVGATTRSPSLCESMEAALVDDPDDRAAHAAYADLLMEQDDPRGEFIRVQLALEDPAVPAGERKKLQKREKELFEAHWKEWFGELASHLSGAFLTGVFLPPDRGGDHLRMARGWLDHLEIDYLMHDLATRLARAPQVRLLRELEIRSEEQSGPRGRHKALSHLAAAPLLGNVRSLSLGADSEEGDDWTFPLGGIIVNAAIPDIVRQMPRLESLALWADGYNLGKLFSLPTLTRLRMLQVYHVSAVHPLDLLAANPAFGNLTHLLLQPPRLEIGEPASIRLEGVWALVRSPHLKSLTHLQLRMSDMGDAGIEEIIRSGILKRLKRLDLRCGTVTDEGARLLAECPDARRLERLDLTYNLLTADGVAALRPLGGRRVRAEESMWPDHYFYEVQFE
jgi:uncharacterized protein (TIGR02996 family)